MNVGPLLVVSRSLGCDDERLLWRKQTLRMKISAAIVDPTETLDAGEIKYIPFMSAR